MRAHRKSKRLAEPVKNASASERLNEAQLNTVMRHVFAWMWVGMGITASVAGAMRVHPIYPDLAITVIVLVAQFALAFGLSRKLPSLSPTQAVAAFVLYSALTGFTLSTIISMLHYPTVSDTVVTVCISTAGLFGLMTLIGWRTRLDFRRARSFVLMTLLGLALAFLANKLADAAPWEYIFSFFSVLLFSALAADHRKVIDSLVFYTALRIQPTDSLRFSILVALQLYVNACLLFAFVVYACLTGRSSAIYYDSHLHHHQGRHYSGIGIGSSGGGFGSGGGGMGSGGGGSIGGGGGGSFTP